MELRLLLGSHVKYIVFNADLAQLGSPSQAGQMDYSVNTGTCESLEMGDGEGGPTVE